MMTTRTPARTTTRSTRTLLSIFAAGLFAAPIAAQTTRTVYLKPDMDSYSTASSASNAYGTKDYMAVSLGRQAFLRFDTRSIPCNARVVGVSLSLRGHYVYTSNAKNPATVHRIVSPWDEATLTHNNQPRVETLHYLGRIALAPSKQETTYQRDLGYLASTVESWIEKPASNHGIRITHAGGPSFDSMSSREGKNPPVLRIDYSLSGSCLPDLRVTMSLPRAATMGQSLTVRGSVANYGKLSPSSSVEFRLSLASGRDVVLGSWPVPALSTWQRVSFSKTLRIPQGICGGKTLWLSAVVDPKNKIREIHKHNNTSRDLISIGWPTTAGYYVGAVGKSISSASRSNTLGFCSKKVGSLPKDTWYFFFMSSSGTTPGIDLPVGRVHLNLDSLTFYFTTRYDSDLPGLFGKQSTSSVGSNGYMRGGSWLAPLKGRTLYSTAAYFTPSAGLVGVAKNALSFRVE